MTKNESEIIADIRNKYGPILTYFTLKEEIDSGIYPEDKRKALESLMAKELPKAIECNKTVVNLLRSLG